MGAGSIHFYTFNNDHRFYCYNPYAILLLKNFSYDLYHYGHANTGTVNILRMPANKKYFSSTHQRILKITAGSIGGYLLTLNIHLFFMKIFERKNIVVTGFFSEYILWAILLLLAFLSQNGLKIWVIYIILSFLFLLPYYPELFHTK